MEERHVGVGEEPDDRRFGVSALDHLGIEDAVAPVGAENLGAVAEARGVQVAALVAGAGLGVDVDGANLGVVAVEGERPVGGEGDGLTWAEFGRVHGRPPWDIDPTVPLSPGSESWSGFVERASAGLAAVADRHPGQLVVVACHGGVIEASFAAWGGVPMAGPGLRPENTGLTIWSHRDGRPWRLERYNDSAHLDGQDL